MTAEAHIPDDWYQGDVSFDVSELPVVASPDGEEVDPIGVSGVVIITQTCDLFRDREAKPYFQAAGLRKVNDSELNDIRNYGRPQFIYVPQLAEQRLVGDLDLVASYDKQVLDQWKRVPAPTDAIARREFGYAVGRHKSRHAFPDRWAIEFSPVRNWLRSKSTKQSDEGEFARAIEQMRIIANDVDCPLEADVMCFYASDTPDEKRAGWALGMLPKLRQLISVDWGCDVSFRLVHAANITAHDYLSSIRLDFDALSRAA